ncbi:MAG: hypothetical protein ACR2L2_16405 [Acidobacteriota bacterium]
MLLLKSLLFVFLIPPWQVPDEPSHVDYALHFHDPDRDSPAGITASLTEFETWRYSEGASSKETTRFSDRFQTPRDCVSRRVPAVVDSSSICDVTRHPFGPLFGAGAPGHGSVLASSSAT